MSRVEGSSPSALDGAESFGLVMYPLPREVGGEEVELTPELSGELFRDVDTEVRDCRDPTAGLDCEFTEEEFLIADIASPGRDPTLMDPTLDERLREVGLGSGCESKI